MNIYDVLSWIAFIVAGAMIIWYILGDSPAEMAILVPLLFMIYTRISSVNTKAEINEFKLNNLINDFRQHAENHKRG